MKKIVFPTLTMLGLLLLWAACVRAFQVPAYVLPPPADVIRALASDFPALLPHVAVTAAEAFVGMGIALLAAFALGILIDWFPAVRACIYPILVVTQTVPVIVLAPLFIIYLGFGMAPKVLVVVLMCFFPVAVGFSDALAKVDAEYLNLFRALGAGHVKTYALLKIPASAGALFSGLKVAATYSIGGAVVGEWISSQAGLGYYILKVKNSYRIDKLLACVLLIVALSLLMNALVRLSSYILLPWERKNKGGRPE
jgi:ABC-type nitrate/sulfonate/bicarbonate transport system permease component